MTTLLLCPVCTEPMRLIADRTWRCGWCATVVIGGSEDAQ